MVHGDQVAPRVEAMHLHQRPRRGRSVNHQQQIPVVAIQFGTLTKMLGVLDGEGMEAEGLPQQRLRGLGVEVGQIQPESA